MELWWIEIVSVTTMSLDMCVCVWGVFYVITPPLICSSHISFVFPIESNQTCIHLHVCCTSTLGHLHMYISKMCLLCAGHLTCLVFCVFLYQCSCHVCMNEHMYVCDYLLVCALKQTTTITHKDRYKAIAAPQHKIHSTDSAMTAPKHQIHNTDTYQLDCLYLSQICSMICP